MAIRVQPFVIDEAVLDLIGNEFKFDHAKGLAEWLKNSCDAYLREGKPDSEQVIIIRLTDDNRGQLIRVECIDFVGMEKRQIDEAFKRFFDPQAAKKGAKDSQLKTLGGHGNGGKFYMRQMFRTSKAVTYRNGKLNVFGFNSKRQYGFEAGFEDLKTTPKKALQEAGIESIALPEDLKNGVLNGETGFTVVVGEYPHKVRGTSERDKLVDKLIMHPQARRLIEQKPIKLLVNRDTEPLKLTPPRVVPKVGFEKPLFIPIPEVIEWEGKQVAFTGPLYPPGRLVLRTSNDPLRGNLQTLNTVDFSGEVGVIASYRIYELGSSRFSGQTEFIYGECECPILEDPDNDCVRNDRQKLLAACRT